MDYGKLIKLWDTSWAGLASPKTGVYEVIIVNIGSDPAVTIQDFQMAKDLFNKEEWCGRGQGIISRYFRSDNGINKVLQLSVSL